MTATLPEIVAGDLPGLDAEVPCEAPGPPECRAPAVWRCTVTCSGCGRVDIAHTCGPHKVTLTRELPWLVSVCCDARPVNVGWAPL